MALASYSGWASYDAPNAAHLDLSDELSAVLLADTFMLGRIPVGGVATNVDHYWVEETLNGLTLTLNESAELTAADTTLTIVASSAPRVGDLLMDEAIGKQEVMQVTTVTNTTTLTVVRGVGDSAVAAQTHDAAAVLRIIASPVQEGHADVADRTVARTRVHNVCQIFKKEIEISGTQQAIRLAGVPDEFNHQVAMRLLQLRRELGMSTLQSVKITSSGAGGSDSVYRSMNGIRNFTRANSGQNLTTSEALDEGVVNKLYRLIYSQGGEGNFAVGAADQLTKFSEMYKDKVRLAPSEKQRGVFVTKFLTDLGVELDLVIDRWCLPGDLIIGDQSRLRLVPLQGRALQSTPLAKTGDAMRGMIVGEYTLEVRNAAQSFALHSGLTA